MICAERLGYWDKDKGGHFLSEGVQKTCVAQARMASENWRGARFDCKDLLEKDSKDIRRLERL